MADLGDADRKIEQALLALKKGAQLLKYGRKGKPKFYPFRLSNDETSLIWISSSGERSLKLASVSRIIPGQRTAVFQRYLRPEKDYLSFSLIFNGGKRSLDLICKDKVEAEIWIAGLKTLTSSGQAGRSKIDGWSDGGFYLDGNSNVTSNTPSNSSASATREIISSPDVSTNLNVTSSPKSNHPENSTYLERLHVPFYQPNIQMKGSGPDAYRVSVSSAPSTSSHSSAADDCDALGDVYIWGEVICDTVVKVGLEKNASSITKSSDILIPRLLESNVVLDVQHIACGVNHAALVTRQGEVFSWGKESGGRLGHGVGKDVTQPHLVESLTFSTVDSVACGEFHTCAVTMSGELYTWGDGTHYAGLLGHGTHVSHWIPKRIAGPLEGIQVAMVTCGPWHTALITSTGRLFTFGDGTFGVLGHGSRESASYPREVESLSGLRTVAVACGVWHTAAVIEVIATQSNASVFSGKMFTWGDGDKNRLGHGDKESRLNPTCVPSLIDYNFHKIACGHSLTAGVTTSGQVFTMGSTVYGQLGNPQSDGKLPCLVGDKLAAECVEEISCGAYHVAVLTSKNEVFTWGKGADGRLGHGDIEDRKLPTPVVTLKDRHVKFIACGSNYTSAICLHKWVSSAQQSQCSTCRQSFGFTRKKHNCYNCGLVHCHACSSKKAMWAVLAPNLNKPYRVCDSCFSKLGKMAESGPHNKRNSRPRFSGENKDRMDNADLQLAKSGMPSNLNLITQLDTKAGKRGKKANVFSLGQTSQISLLQLREAVMSTGAELRKNIPKPILTHSTVDSRPVSPLWSKRSSPRSATPVPTTSGLSFGKSISDGLNKTNDLLNRDVHKFRMQVKTLKSICELQESELKQTVKKTREAMAVADKESAKCEAAKDVIKLLTAQLKDMAERLSPGAYDPDILKLSYLPNGSEPNGTPRTGADGENNPRSETMNRSYSAPRSGTHLSEQNRTLGASELLEDANNKSSLNTKIIPNGDANIYENLGSKESASSRQKEGGLKERNSVVPGSGGHIEAEWIEQYEPGVYITLVALRDGTRDLKRVRFSRRRFGEHQAETWWSENRDNVLEKYNVGGSEQSSDYGRTTGRSEGALSPSSQF